MNEEELQTISENAWKTAAELTDRKVANAYLSSLAQTHVGEAVRKPHPHYYKI